MAYFKIKESFEETNFVIRSAIIEAKTLEEAEYKYENNDIDWDDYETLEQLDSDSYKLEDITEMIETKQGWKKAEWCDYCGEEIHDCECDKEEIKNIEAGTSLDDV